VHDALLIQAPLERLDEDIFRMRAHMEQASRIVLGGFTVRTDVVIVKHPDPYRTERLGGSEVGAFCPEHERYPPNEEWGTYGFTYLSTDLETALKRWRMLQKGGSECFRA
jgi:hypothetical protein